jgi:tRNA modification GTPase
VAKSDAVIAVLDGSTPLTDADKVFLSYISRKKGLVAINKSDLEQRVALQTVREVIGDKKIVNVSAATGCGIRTLKENLREAILPMPTESNLAVTNLRHKTALTGGERAMGDASAALAQQKPLELVAVALQAAREDLEELVGLVHSEDILERIFSTFCIGK